MFPLLKNIGFLSDLFYWDKTLDRWDDELQGRKNTTLRLSTIVIGIVVLLGAFFISLTRVWYTGDDTIPTPYFKIPIDDTSSITLYQDADTSLYAEHSWQYANPDGEISTKTLKQFILTLGKSQGSPLFQKPVSTSVAAYYPKITELSEAKKNFKEQVTNLTKLYGKPFSTSEKRGETEMQSIWAHNNEFFVLALRSTLMEDRFSGSEMGYKIVHILVDKRNTNLLFNEPEVCLYLSCFSLPFTKSHFVLR